MTDSAGRFRFPILSEGKPEMKSHAGYSTLVARVGQEHPLHCFVYDAPLDAGQAVTRLLRAAQTDLTFTAVRLSAVEFVGGAPLSFFDVDYRERTGETQASGELRVALSPRAAFPVVCSYEGPDFAGPDVAGPDVAVPDREMGFRATVRRALSEFSPHSSFVGAGLSPGDEPLVVEAWVLQDQAAPRGFSQWRVARLPSGRFHALAVSSTFVSKGSDLVTSDSVIVEVSDEEGLVGGRFLEVLGTEVQLELEIERLASPPMTTVRRYRVRGKVGLERVDGHFEVERALDTTLTTFLWLRQLDASKSPDQDSQGDTSRRFLQYVPAVAPLGALPLEIEDKSDGTLRFVRAGATEIVTLGADGLPQSIGEKQGARLLSRTVQPALASVEKN